MLRIGSISSLRSSTVSNFLLTPPASLEKHSAKSVEDSIKSSRLGQAYNEYIMKPMDKLFNKIFDKIADLNFFKKIFSKNT